jgi:hypothetical protein
MNGQLKWWLTTGTTANAAKSQDRGKAPEPPPAWSDFPRDDQLGTVCNCV